MAVISFRVATVMVGSGYHVFFRPSSLLRSANRHAAGGIIDKAL